MVVVWVAGRVRACVREQEALCHTCRSIQPRRHAAAICRRAAGHGGGTGPCTWAAGQTATCTVPPARLLQATYDAFMRNKPTLEAFESELRKYNTLEQEIAGIPTLHNIGARQMMLAACCTSPLRGLSRRLRAAHALATTGSRAANPGASGVHPLAFHAAEPATPLVPPAPRAPRPWPSLPLPPPLRASPAGSLSLDTAPLKNSLRSEAASWKAQFAQNLHRQCAEDLKSFDK